MKKKGNFVDLDKDEYEKKKFKKILIRFILFSSISALIVLTASSIFIYNYVNNIVRTLPPVEKILAYEQIVPTSIYSKDEKKIGEIFIEKRYPININQVNKKIIDAFLSAEDSRFFEHPGIDIKGTLRAGLHWIFNVGQKQGGSSITQQLAKILILSKERTIERKIKDMAVAIEIEKLLSKQKILELYLNTIFLGNNSYGIEAAARNYFRKTNADLTLAECALIAGLTPAPSAYSPLESLKKAKARQKFVLEQMLKNKKITLKEANEAYKQSLKIYRAETPNAKAAPYFFSEVKKQLEKLISPADLATKGYKVITTLDLKLQYKVQNVLSAGLAEYQDKKSFKGPTKKFGTNFEQAVTELINSPLDESENNKAIVVDIYPKLGVILVISKHGFGVLLAEEHNWIFSTQAEKDGEPLTFQNILNIGDEVQIANSKTETPRRVLQSQLLQRKIKAYSTFFNEDHLSNNIPVFLLSNVDKTEASALIANATTGEVLAVIGGTGFETTQFNRATQAKRQVGSSIKPLYYAMAQDEGFSPTSLLDSPPIVIGDWRPENYSKEFQGRTTLRRSLINSYNIASIQLMQALGLKKTVNYFSKLGLNWNEKIGGFSLALGAGNATLLQMVQAYTVFANSGKIAELYYISKIIDPKGNIIYSTESTPEKLKIAKIEPVAVSKEKNNLDNPSDSWKYDSKNPLQVMSPEAAFVTMKIMQDVIKFGTGTKAIGVSPDAAGKTGTTNNYTDAWFLGVLPEFVGGVWIGFDDANKSLGNGSSGGKIAAPLWRAIMSELVESYPQKQWSEPKNISWIKINPDTGQLSTNNGGMLIPTINNTEPGGIMHRDALGVLGIDSINESNKRTDATNDDSSSLRYSY